MSLQAFLAAAIGFVNDTVIPLLLAVAFVIFLFNVARYFIIQEEKRDEAKRTALWGILAFVVIVSIWGIVNLFVNGLSLRNDAAPCPDYNPFCEAKLNNTTREREKNNNPNDAACVGGLLCYYHEDGTRSCFSC